MLPTLPITRPRGPSHPATSAVPARRLARLLRHGGMALLVAGVAASTLTFNFVIFHDRAGNYFPEFSGQVAYLSDVLLGAGVLAWLAGLLAGGGGRLRAGPAWVWAPLAVLTGLSVMSLLWADQAAVAQVAGARRALLLLVYVALVSEARTAGPAVAATLVGLAALHATVALAQVYGQSAVGLGGLGELRPGMFGYEAIGRPRGFGLGFSPNPAGAFIAAGGLLAYGTLLSRARPGWIMACASAALAVSIAGVGATESRSAAISLVAGGAAITAVALLRDRDRLRRLAPYAAHTALLLVIAGGGFILATSSGGGASVLGLERFSPGSLRGGVAARDQDLGLSFPIIREHITGGVGAGNYPLALKQEIARDAVAPKMTPVHNVPLLLLAELGPLGLAAWAALVAAPIAWLAGALAGRRRPLSGALLWAGPLVAVLVESMFDFTPWATQDGRVVFIAVLALWAGSVSGRNAGEENVCNGDGREAAS